MNLICQSCQTNITSNIGCNITCSCILCTECTDLSTNILQCCPVCMKSLIYSYQITSSQFISETQLQFNNITKEIQEHYSINKQKQIVPYVNQPKQQRLFLRENVSQWNNQTLLDFQQQESIIKQNSHQACIGDIVLLADCQDQFLVVDFSSNSCLVVKIKKISKDIFVDFLHYQWIQNYCIQKTVQQNEMFLSDIKNNITLLLNQAKNQIFSSSQKLNKYHQILNLSQCLSQKIKLGTMQEQTQLQTYTNYIRDNLIRQDPYINIKNIQSGLKVNIDNFQIGLCVIRNPQCWKFGDQDKSHKPILIDGQYFYIGYLVSYSETNKLALVKWENGSVQNYRIGYDDKYDLVYYINDIANQQIFKLNDLKTCTCCISSGNYLLQSNLHIEQKLHIYSSIISKQENIQYIKDHKFDISKYSQIQTCLLDYNSYNQFSIEHYDSFIKYIQLGPKQKRTNLCKYPQYHQVTEKYAKSKFVTKKMCNQLLLQHTSIPVQASQQRIKLPSVVTISEDWHHGNQFNNKIGILVPNSKIYQTFQACVIWSHEIRKLPQYQIMLDQFDKIYETGIFDHSYIEKSILIQAHIYDAGRQNLMELQYYNLLVTIINFQSKSLVGPSMQWQLEQGQLCGLLLWQQNQWAIVLWMDGSVNRHKIGHDGIYELCYLDYSLE
ncbi:Mib_herc2 domain-containing protein [Spironucleus salmonicida]|uniref:Mib_herc2 domain-containing protein n=1 Tax=Spironucleus salmonicida TaxID=348837 RepID=V6M003_9EUKA|nr:Mib_herc2 domain-containing protein [Spironucleus salmonicida]|eukprot:EST49346.1 Mib_herc2 domain-containing protein [Spironucleus salmonicida]